MDALQLTDVLDEKVSDMGLVIHTHYSPTFVIVYFVGVQAAPVLSLVTAHIRRFSRYSSITT